MHKNKIKKIEKQSRKLAEEAFDLVQTDVVKAKELMKQSNELHDQLPENYRMDRLIQGIEKFKDKNNSELFDKVINIVKKLRDEK